MFFLEDHHFLEREFIEVVNSLLSAGEIPGLYSPEELEPLLAPLKDSFQAAQSEGSNAPRTCFEHFVNRCRENLRVVLSMDPTHPHFLSSVAANPALFKDCVVLWMDQWSEIGKEVVCAAKFKRILHESASAEDQKKLAALALSVHNSQLEYQFFCVGWILSCFDVACCNRNSSNGFAF